MTPLYEKTIVGWPMILFVACMAVFLAVLLAIDGEGGAAWFSLALLLIPLLMGFMKVSVHVGELRIRFLTGFPRRTVDLHDVESMTVIRSWWKTGLGISVKPLQGRFCVTGPDAVVLTMKSGLPIVVGTPEPKKLLKALNRARDRHAGRS